MRMNHEIYKIVGTYRCRYDCSNAFRLADDLRIVVMKENLGNTTGNKAMTYCHNRITIILLNSNLPEVIQDFVLYHEIGHYALHRDYFQSPHFERDVYGNRQMEIEANQFAAEILLNDDEILQEIFESGYTFYQLASIHRITPELLAYKFMLLSEKGYKVSPVPEYPPSDFLTGTLGMDEGWNEFSYE